MQPKILKFQAKKIFDGQIFLPDFTSIIYNEAGKICKILFNDIQPDEQTKMIDGIVCPGFINAHCHIELSHLKSSISMHTGVLEFLVQVISKRHLYNNDSKTNAIKNVIKNFEDEGVVAIGDICNTSDSIEAKKKSTIFFYNFIETIGFDAIFNAEKFNTFQQLLRLFHQHLPQHKSNLSPHATYSFSSAMFEKLAPEIKQKIATIHNQECKEENDFFKNKTGLFLDFYKRLNINIDFFKPTNLSSLQSIWRYLSGTKKNILVHNTYTTPSDILFLQQQKNETFICLCVNANLYIENTLPPVEYFYKNKLKMVIGTDSFASNHSMVFFEEIKTIHKKFPKIPTTEILKWATYNGAESLDVSDKLGSIKENQSPGFVVIKDYEEKENQILLHSITSAKKL